MGKIVVGTLVVGTLVVEQLLARSMLVVQKVFGLLLLMLLPLRLEKVLQQLEVKADSSFLRIGIRSFGVWGG